MAENSGTDPTVDSNVDKNDTTEGTMIVVTVKTPKDKEEIAISEDSSVAQVHTLIVQLCKSCSVAIASNVSYHLIANR